MPDYTRFCPISMASSVLSDRWTPMILREMVIGSTRFNDIARGLPGISRSLLVQRLKHLERAGVLERWPSPVGRGSEYHLTPAGKDLESVLMAFGRWAVHWLFHELDVTQVDAVTLMWWMHRRVDTDQVPESRVVIQFDHTAPERVTLWLVFERGAPSVCLQHPGFDSDLVVTSTTPGLARVFQGYTTWAHALATGEITVAGPPRLIRAIPRWFLWSPFADATLARAALERTG